jgi:hypothetical protein
VLWAIAQATWGLCVFQAYVMSWRGKRKPWPGLFLFLLAFWAAFLINGTFDVFIEGPMGGIWFWTLWGVGVGAVWIYRRNPEVLTPASITA